MDIFRNSFARGSLPAFRRTTTVSHINAQGNIQCSDDRNSKLKKKQIISELITDIYEYTPVAYGTIPCMVGR